jgi:peptide-methionine (S)-S-oxide reductase|tara:strand:+ start:1316 stop:1786 length:471 start_codon:yes stop_codon:yes gene_type:complete
MTEKATFAAGCFWHVESTFSKVKGVVNTKVGYTGGKMKKPSYKHVCSGNTGHAESIDIEFDPKVVSYNELLEVFWKIHDPTTLNRQGADVGTQYRSAIFYHNDKQKKQAENSLKNVQKSLKNKIVTQIKKSPEFYKAEEYHQKYMEKNIIQRLFRI